MTCFWNGLIKGLNNMIDKIAVYENKPILISGLKSLLNRDSLIALCAKNADILCADRTKVLWDGECEPAPLTEKEILTHHIPKIKEIELIDRTDGYNCGAPDSFLLFICMFFEIDIIHYAKAHTGGGSRGYKSVVLKYTNVEPVNKKMIFTSNTGHFTFSKSEYIR